MTRLRILGWLAILPCLVAASASAVQLMKSSTGRPLWGSEPETLPEAVASRNFGEVVRLIGLGTDPNRAAPVRADFVGGAPLRLTPLEAAVAKGYTDIAQILLDYGASPDSDALSRLRCYAEARRSSVRDLLVSLSPEPWPDCRQVQLPTRR